MSVMTATAHLRLRPSRGWQALNLRELWEFRDLLITLAGRDVKLRYRQTALGIIWVVLQPLIAAGIFAIVFGFIAKLPSDGVPYFIFSYAGLLGWSVFSNTLTKASFCLVQHGNLISKVYFPRLMLPLSTVYSSIIDFGVALAVMLCLLAAFHIAPTAAILLLPIWFIVFAAIAMGLGLCAAALMVSYRDLAYVIPVGMQLLMYASPVAYGLNVALKRVPQSFHALKLFYTLNPLSGPLEGMRWSLLGRGHISLFEIGYSVAFSVLCLVGGAYVFKRMEKRFADVI